MREIALHLLDIVQNSVRAQAEHVRISLDLNAQGILRLCVQDDGCGMPPELLERVRNPFVTTRSTRRIGLGIPLLTQNAVLSGGSVDIQSTPGEGTEVTALFNTTSIDCLPLGDVASTVATLVMGSPDRPEFELRCTSPAGEMHFSTQEIRPALEGVSLAESAVVAWIQQSIQEEIEPILGGIMR